MALISSIASERNIAVVEDASHALGSVYPNEGANVAVGGCIDSNMAIFSFHPVKTIAMGEGGAITTNDAASAERLKSMRNHGMNRNSDSFVNRELAFDSDGQANPWYYEMQEPGFNYRASDIHCALGLSQLGKLDRFVNRRQELVALFDQYFAPLAPVVKPLRRKPGNPAWHLYVALIDFDLADISRASLIRQLRDNGIGSQVHYIPVHRQPYYQQRYGDDNLPGADKFYGRCLSLPLFPGMKDEDVERVVKTIQQIIG